jgi:hypothetical protein
VDALLKLELTDWLGRVGRFVNVGRHVVVDYVYTAATIDYLRILLPGNSRQGLSRL